MQQHQDGYGCAEEEVLSRRQFFLASGLIAAACSLGGCTTAAATRDAPTRDAPTSASDQMQLLMKMMASGADACVPWYYTGRIYAVRPATAALHLYNFEGSEIYWVKRLAPGRWSLAISTLTFYPDRESGDYLEHFSNPLTGKTVEVKPNVLRSRPGQGAIYGEKTLTAFGVTVPITLEIHRDAEVIWLTSSRANVLGPQPSMEVNSIFSPTVDIDDHRRSSARATTSTVSLSPWSKWLEMGAIEGHLMWHSAGRKLASFDELPTRYRQRADAQGSRHFENPENDTHT
jgi:hypothetical protein